VWWGDSRGVRFAENILKKDNPGREKQETLELRDEVTESEKPSWGEYITSIRSSSRKRKRGAREAGH